VSGAVAFAVRFPVVAEWLSHSSSRERLIVYAMSSAVSGWPSDHLRFGRSLYVHRLPSAEPSHDSARPGVVAKSFAALSVRVAYYMFQASKAATVTPRSGFMLSIPCVMPMVRTTLPPS
jgi:hypothetical protein